MYWFQAVTSTWTKEKSNANQWAMNASFICQTRSNTWREWEQAKCLSEGVWMDTTTHCLNYHGTRVRCSVLICMKSILGLSRGEYAWIRLLKLSIWGHVWHHFDEDDHCMRNSHLSQLLTTTAILSCLFTYLCWKLTQDISITCFYSMWQYLYNEKTYMYYNSNAESKITWHHKTEPNNIVVIFTDDLNGIYNSLLW